MAKCNSLTMFNLLQFLHRIDNKEIAVLKQTSGDNNQSQIICSVTDKNATLDISKTFKTDIVATTPDVFGGSSENGVLVGLADQSTYVLDAPYSSYVVEI
jgi:hypothetical protein